MSCMLGSVFSEVCSPCSWISEIRDVSPTPPAGVALRSGVRVALGMGTALRLGVVIALVLCSIVAGLTEDRI